MRASSSLPPSPHFHPPQLPQGFVLPGGYVIEGMLGSGGFGAVYAAHDPALARPVAVKLLTRELTGQAAERFRDEGRLLAKLRHPNIIQVYASGALPDSDGRAYLVMERFGEGSLASHWPLGTRPPLELATHITQQLLSALSAAHEAGVIHRDVKEANVLYDSHNNEIKLCDFGIARSLTPLPEQADTTQEGVVVGTDHYIAPERLVGVHDDPRSDLYSAGVLMYRLLTGHRPFERSAEERPARPMILLRALQETPTLPDHIPLRWRRLCLALLARDPTHRPESASRALLMLSDAEGITNTESAPISLSFSPHRLTSDMNQSSPAPAHSHVKLIWLALGLMLPALVFAVKELLWSPPSPRPSKVIKLNTHTPPQTSSLNPLLNISPNVSPNISPNISPQTPPSPSISAPQPHSPGGMKQETKQETTSSALTPIKSKQRGEQKSPHRLKKTSRRETPATRASQRAQPVSKKGDAQGGSPFIFPSEPQEGQ